MARRWTRSPFLRIALILPLATGVLISVMLVPVYEEAIRYIRQEVDATVLVETLELLDRSQTPPAEELTELLRTRIAAPIDEDAIYVLQDVAQQTLVANLPSWPKDAPHEHNAIFRVVLDDGRSLVGRVSQLNTGGYLLVGRRAPLAEFRRHMSQQLVLSAIAVTLLCGLITYFFMRQMHRRLALMAQDAAIVASGVSGYRLAARKDGDELDELAARFNDALARIEQLMEAARHVSSAIAHDMRRPLIRLRNHIEQARNEAAMTSALGPMLEETDRVLRSFAALLRLARIEAGTLATARSALSLEGVLTDVAELYEPVVRDRGRRLLIRLPMLADGTSGPAPSEVLGDRELLCQALANLVENALHYGDGDIELCLGADGRGMVLLSVRDYGAGVPPAALPYLFDRFYRVDTSRSDADGAGIGLALVTGIAVYHGGQARAVNVTPGLRVTLELPGLRAT